MIDDDAFDLRLNLETLRYAGEAIDDRLERFLANRSRFRCAGVFRLKNRRRFPELCFLASFSFFDGVDFVSRHLPPQSTLSVQGAAVVFAVCACLYQRALVQLRYSC